MAFAYTSLRRRLTLGLIALLLLAARPGLAAARPPDGRVITIASPANGAAVSSPVTITGGGTTTPFESNLAYRVFDGTGAIVGQGSITVQGTPGGAYTFAAPVNFSIRTSGPGRIDIIDGDVAGGTPFATASLNVTLLESGPGGVCFDETGFCIEGRFLETWVRNGGLAINGLPLSGVFEQQLEDGNTREVQYFERVRMEYHPENQPPYDVLLGQFGRHILAGVSAAPTARAQPLAGYGYFPETGHNVGPRFSTFWQTNGGLAQFGYPLTELFEQILENGKVYQVQYFERARFEYHPENQPPYDVLLGQFGRRILAETALPRATITLTSPQDGATVGPTFEVHGTISRIPFERNLSYRVTAADTGTLLTLGAITVQGPEGGPGTFVVRIMIAGEFSVGARVEVRDVDAGTGTVLASAVLTVNVVSP